MFIWDFVAETVLGQVVDWFYGQVLGFLGDFFAQMGNMGADLFDMSWVQSVVLFFSYLAMALYVVGLVVACFECAIEFQSGRGSVKDVGINAIKGFMAVGLFTTVPVELYKLSVSLQGSFTRGLTGFGRSFGDVAGDIIKALQDGNGMDGFGNSGMFGGLASITSPILIVFILIMMGYSVIKVFFANLKRGGILVIQIAVGSLYMFSVPRGYIDGFTSWCKQIVGLCLTSFLQVTMLIAGLLVIKEHALLGLGLMLASSEIPRIAGQFGLDTTTKGNIMSSIYAAQSAVNMTKTVVHAISK